MYEVGKIYIWQGGCGAYAFLNGTETTVLGRMQQTGWQSTDTVVPLTEPSGKVVVTRILAKAGDLRPKNLPPGERLIRDLFNAPELA